MRASLLILPIFAATVAAGLLLIPDSTGVNVLPAIIAIALVMIGVERLMPGAKTPETRFWYPRAIALNVCQVAIVVTAGFTWNEWMRGASLFAMHARHDALASAATYLVSTLIFYWWHRYRHESEFWWRFAHQIHHSAARLEVLTSFYKNPLEILIDSVMSSVLLYPLMGCSAKQGAIYTLIIGLAGLFYHWNVRTPRWVGHIIQRPESHRMHHMRGRHTKNYGDLPLWDKLFGTFSNPSRADRLEVGFADDKETRLRDMMRGVSVEPARDSDPIRLGAICIGCSMRRRCAKAREIGFP